MFSTCIFCHDNLGRNEAIEHFPVGRRLAFDVEKGRLWVVCRRCSRWNLSPIEERWEAIEDCERLFRETKLRVSTNQIGLSRLREGTELVRVGRPERPEFAAWRYGDQFGRRRRVMYVKVGLGLGAVGAVIAGGAAAGIGIGGFGYWTWQIIQSVVHGSPDAVVARLPQPLGDEPIKVRRKHLKHVRLLPDDGDRWTLEVPAGKKKGVVFYEGDQAVRAIGSLLPQLNRFGGSQADVSEAVGLLEEVGDPMRYFARIARHSSRAANSKERAIIGKLPEPVRLALEMAAHEDSERRALEGELAELESAWREAEEIAGIADNMFLPASVDDFLKRYRQPVGTGAVAR